MQTYSDKELIYGANIGTMDNSGQMQVSDLDKEIEALGRIINAEKMFNDLKDQADVKNKVFEMIKSGAMKNDLTGGAINSRPEFVDTLQKLYEGTFGPTDGPLFVEKVTDITNWIRAQINTRQKEQLYYDLEILVPQYWEVKGPIFNFLKQSLHKLSAELHPEIQLAERPTPGVKYPRTVALSTEPILPSPPARVVPRPLPRSLTTSFSQLFKKGEGIDDMGGGAIQDVGEFVRKITQDLKKQIDQETAENNFNDIYTYILSYPDKSSRGTQDLIWEIEHAIETSYIDIKKVLEEGKKEYEKAKIDIGGSPYVPAYSLLVFLRDSLSNLKNKLREQKKIEPKIKAREGFKRKIMESLFGRDPTISTLEINKYVTDLLVKNNDMDLKNFIRDVNDVLSEINRKNKSKVNKSVEMVLKNQIANVLHSKGYAAPWEKPTAQYKKLSDVSKIQMGKGNLFGGAVDEKFFVKINDQYASEKQPTPEVINYIKRSSIEDLDEILDRLNQEYIDIDEKSPIIMEINDTLNSKRREQRREQEERRQREAQKKLESQIPPPSYHHLIPPHLRQESQVSPQLREAYLQAMRPLSRKGKGNLQGGAITNRSEFVATLRNLLEGIYQRSEGKGEMDEYSQKYTELFSWINPRVHGNLSDNLELALDINGARQGIERPKKLIPAKDADGNIKRNPRGEIIEEENPLFYINEIFDYLDDIIDLIKQIKPNREWFRTTLTKLLRREYFKGEKGVSSTEYQNKFKELYDHMRFVQKLGSLQQKKELLEDIAEITKTRKREPKFILAKDRESGELRVAINPDTGKPEINPFLYINKMWTLLDEVTTELKRQTGQGLNLYGGAIQSEQEFRNVLRDLLSRRYVPDSDEYLDRYKEIYTWMYTILHNNDLKSKLDLLRDIIAAEEEFPRVPKYVLDENSQPIIDRDTKQFLISPLNYINDILDLLDGIKERLPLKPRFVTQARIPDFERRH